MKILVTGANGQLGSELQHLATTQTKMRFTFTDVAELDITNESEVFDFFKAQEFDYCINCAAYTAVDKAETERDLCDKINVLGSTNLAKGCKSVGATLFHISTDFVFDDNASAPQNEDQDTDPVNYYGVSKLNGENAIRDLLDAYFIIRTSWLYSAFGDNFVKTMLRLGKERDELNVISDQIGTPTYAKDLADLILKMIESNSNSFGVYHYSNEGAASWYDFAAAIFEYKKITTQVNPIPTSSYPTAAKRPHYSVMDKTKIKKEASIEIRHWRDSLRDCLSRL